MKNKCDRELGGPPFEGRAFASTARRDGAVPAPRARPTLELWLLAKDLAVPLPVSSTQQLFAVSVLATACEVLVP